MAAFGLKIDPERNRRIHGIPGDVAADESRVRILVIPTNEELAIARYAQGVSTPVKSETLQEARA